MTELNASDKINLQVGILSLIEMYGISGDSDKICDTISSDARCMRFMLNTVKCPIVNITEGTIKEVLKDNTFKESLTYFLN